jgi:hypothetical protein
MQSPRQCHKAPPAVPGGTRTCATGSGGPSDLSSLSSGSQAVILSKGLSSVDSLPSTLVARIGLPIRISKFCHQISLVVMLTVRRRLCRRGWQTLSAQGMPSKVPGGAVTSAELPNMPGVGGQWPSSSSPNSCSDPKIKVRREIRVIHMLWIPP